MADRISNHLPDLGDEFPLDHLFDKLLDTEPQPFLQTIQPISHALIPKVYARAERTLKMAEARMQQDSSDAQLKKLQVDDLAAIIKYCQEDSDPPFYRALNEACYNRDRAVVKQFVPFMWRLLNAMQKLPAYEKPTVFRGVRKDLAKDYQEHREVTWYGFTSSTKTQKALESEAFCGKSGERTIFTITLTQGQAKDISHFSPLDEGEVLLPPCSRFRVQSPPADLGNGLHLIHLEEVESDMWILDLRHAQEAAMTAEEWTQLGVGGGGWVGDKRYSGKDCYEMALEVDEAYALAWGMLGWAGGGIVCGETYSAQRCFEMAAETYSPQRCHEMAAACS